METANNDESLERLKETGVPKSKDILNHRSFVGDPFVTQTPPEGHRKIRENP